MTRTILLLSALAVLLTSTAALAQEGLQLRYKFEKDKPLRYKLQMQSKAIFTMPDGNVQNLNMKTYIELTQEMIEQKADGTYRLAVSIDKAAQIVNGQSSPLQNMPPTLVTMKATGEIADAQAASPAAGTQQLQMIFPDKVIKEGDQWKQTQTLQQPLPMVTTTTYTLNKAQSTFPGYPKSVALIKNAMNLENTETATKETVSSETRGNLWFDVARGAIVRSKASSKFNFKLPINIPGLVPENSTVKVDMELGIEISLMEASDKGGIPTEFAAPAPAPEAPPAGGGN